MASKKPIIIENFYKGREEREYEENAPALRADRQGLLVSDSQKLTSTQSVSTKDTIPNTKTMEMQQLSMFSSSPTLTYLLEGSHAKRLVSLANERDSWTQEEHYFLKSLGFLSTNDPDILYSKTYQAYLVMKVEKLSVQYLEFSPTLGIELNGKYLILKTTEYRRTEKESSLSDVLESTVDPKYFLPTSQIEKMGIRVEKNKREGRQFQPSILDMDNDGQRKPMFKNKG